MLFRVYVCVCQYVCSLCMSIFIMYLSVLAYGVCDVEQCIVPVSLMMAGV